MIECVKVGTAVYKVICDGQACGRVFFDPNRGTWGCEDGSRRLDGFETRADAAAWIVEDHFNFLSTLD